MSGGFYLNGREASDLYGESSSNVISSQPQPHNQIEETISRLRERIKMAEKLNKFEDCLQFTEEGLKITANSMDFVILKAKFLVLFNRSDEASKIISEIIKNNPQNAECIGILGLIFYYQGNLKKAVEVFTDALKIDSTLIYTKTLRDKAVKISRILQEISDVKTVKEFSSTKRLIDEALVIETNNLEVKKTLLFYQGILNYNNNHYQAAIKDFTEVLKLDQLNVYAFMYRAKCYKNIFFYDDSIIDLMEVDKLSKCKKLSRDIESMRTEISKVYVIKTNYTLLDVARTASDNEIFRAFNSLSILNKVNLSNATTEAEKRKIDFKFKRIEHAFGILSDPQLKKEYEKYLHNMEHSIDLKCCNYVSCMKICSALGECCGGTFTGIGSCFEGLGKCIQLSCCENECLNIFCNSLKFGNILVAFIILLVLYLIFR